MTSWRKDSGTGSLFVTDRGLVYERSPERKEKGNSLPLPNPLLRVVENLSTRYEVVRFTVLSSLPTFLIVPFGLDYKRPGRSLLPFSVDSALDRLTSDSSEPTRPPDVATTRRDSDLPAPQ